MSISDSDRHPDLDYLATIHHGIDMSAFPLVEAHGDYLLFFGRIHPEKGAAEAIEVAKRAGLPLVIAGIVQDHGYFKAEVEPHLDGDRVNYLGPVGPEQRAAVFGGARALLHLISFEEPFGFSVVEAMACGTPVIAYRRGSMPEIITDGGGGLMVENLDEATRAVERAQGMDRLRVRATVVERFDVGRMVEEYLAAYRQVLTLR